MPTIDYLAIGWPALIAVLSLGYLLGSIPFGYVLTKMAGLGDVRSIGSGNIGATNVLRTGNKKLAAATLLLDALKATVAAVVAQLVFGENAGLLAGFAAFIGHLFPIWLGFKGGKGVATYIGMLLGVAPLMVLVFALAWLSVAFITRYSSLSALVATLAIPIVLWILGVEEAALITSAMTAITFWRHKANIERLIAGTESKIGKKG
ncbi:glycerol-3-phosphate 1-O-acyltransferase PlsY [Peteryoungia desertarenae]|uniref:Glycerol-3-phosphate acyltransferase n=1 Tax=Peteryoungia desertarenae TaxID=1813451 RepID=A0ABX6QNP3_9HYPH|nr:glycerol-3-phosphate 1-O-acyltransferase PlsY [Peteryoungia desertarenae]QLF70138.1 glycerol-3-phosphate 1-O-acyltransferase PlsY [Peteryoungia desertarenae]